MPNLIDKLISKVDTVRQKAADKFGLPSFNVYRVLRTWSGGELGNGTASDVVTVLEPTPKVEFTGGYRLDHDGLMDERKAKVTELSLNYLSDFLTGSPRVAGQECIFKFVERNGQGQPDSYWTLTAPPIVNRDEIYWELELSHYVVC